MTYKEGVFTLISTFMLIALITSNFATFLTSFVLIEQLIGLPERFFARSTLLATRAILLNDNVSE